jgi:NhaA family Na+:H+ antiporter
MTTASTAKLTPPISERDHILGPRDTQVTFVEYGDYECPHCRQAHSIVLDLRQRLGDRFRYVFRNFPLTTVHPNAQLAAEAAEAAGVQGKFWEMHDFLFDHQGTLDENHLLEYATRMGLDIDRFRRDLREHTFADRVREDFLNGVRSGVNGTPSFFINGIRYDGPWDIESLVQEIEKPLGVQVRNIFQQFSRIQASGGILLMITTVIAILLANSPWAHGFFQLWETNVAILVGDFSLSEHLLGWINDGLMALFFFVVGLEIKRELIAGELSSLKQAALPVMAAIGGMLVPAGIYFILNAGTDRVSGWAIPMATDIAFTLGLLTILGRRIPLSLRIFFTALAIADDIGAVLVIAIFYSENIVWSSLIAGGIILLILILFNRSGIRDPIPYALLGVGLWFTFLEAGIHPTIAAVLLAMTIPARSEVTKQAFQAQCVSVLGGFNPSDTDIEADVLSSRQQAAAETLETIAERIQNPAQRLERVLSPWAAYLVLPLFALANAGIIFGGNLADVLTTPTSLGISLGLLIGKPLGISLFSWLAVKTRLAELPSRVNWKQLISATPLAGIGFTMSIFIASTAFDEVAILSNAKLSIITGSLLSAIIGLGMLSLTTGRRDRGTEYIDQQAFRSA